MHSRIVVISWWSNGLALACLHRLVAHTHNRIIHVAQVGKSAELKQRFRDHLAEQVIELPYLDDAPAEHSRVLADVALRQLRPAAGVWFIDHDVFLHEDWEVWLKAADEWFSRSEVCLCLPQLPPGVPAITQPAFWLSPPRWPEGIASLDPIPFQARPESRRPDLHRGNGDLRMPIKDTLVQARDELIQQGRVGWFPLTAADAPGRSLPPFPSHTHLGGLSLFTGPVLPSAFDEWMRTTVGRFAAFYAECPPAWRADEEAELMRRVAEFQEAIDAQGRDPVWAQ